jgi:hypothetical protein
MVAELFLHLQLRGVDLNGNFCSLCYQAWFDAGNAPIEHDHAVKAYKARMDTWRVVAGPPGVEVGALYYASVFSRCHSSPSIRFASKAIEFLRHRELTQRGQSTKSLRDSLRRWAAYLSTS